MLLMVLLLEFSILGLRLLWIFFYIVGKSILVDSRFFIVVIVMGIFLYFLIIFWVKLISLGGYFL